MARRRNYTVRGNDDWNSIARAYGVDPGDLARTNADVQNLRPGMVLDIPVPASTSFRGSGGRMPRANAQTPTDGGGGSGGGSNKAKPKPGPWPQGDPYEAGKKLPKVNEPDEGGKPLGDINYPKTPSQALPKANPPRPAQNDPREFPRKSREKDFGKDTSTGTPLPGLNFGSWGSGILGEIFGDIFGGNKNRNQGGGNIPSSGGNYTPKAPGGNLPAPAPANVPSSPGLPNSREKDYGKKKANPKAPGGNLPSPAQSLPGVPQVPGSGSGSGAGDPTRTQLPDTWMNSFEQTSSAIQSQMKAGMLPPFISEADLWMLGDETLQGKENWRERLRAKGYTESATGGMQSTSAAGGSSTNSGRWSRNYRRKRYYHPYTNGERNPPPAQGPGPFVPVGKGPGTTETGTGTGTIWGPNYGQNSYSATGRTVSDATIGLITWRI